VTDLGLLKMARTLEPMAAIVIALPFNGYPYDTVFNLTTSRTEWHEESVRRSQRGGSCAWR
jgi:hypothetical protein